MTAHLLKMASSKSALTDRITLANNLSIPSLHLGVYLMTSNEASTAVSSALAIGYRAFDSAQMYHNERAVGSSILSFLAANPDVKREEIHYTTKIASNEGYEAVRKGIKQSVKECGLGYVDLLLVHSPYGGKQAREESWRAVEDAIEEGECKMGGVSNYGEKHIEELLASNPRHKPLVNQLEVHPFNTRPALTAYCQKNDITIQAYAPLARALRMKHPVLLELAKKHDATPAQVMVRWSLQKGYCPLPKSVNKERMEENCSVGGWQLEEEEVKRLDGLDEYLVTDWDPVDAD
ncbi:uncharacterized protein MYCGRDRAFT_64098 [Zymoseptoria tritici IPO323]